MVIYILVRADMVITAHNIPNQVPVWNVSVFGVFHFPYFLEFGLNKERCFASLHVQSECGQM